MFWDVYSGVVRSIHEKYSKHDPSSFRDWELLCDYKDVERAISANITDDARTMAEELEGILEAEIRRRMNKWRSMANRAATEFYDMLTRKENCNGEGNRLAKVREGRNKAFNRFLQRGN